MTIHAQRITVTTSATHINVASEADFTAGQSVIIRNLDPSVIAYLGGADVTAAAGLPLQPGESVTVDLEPHDELHAITQSGSASCAVLQAGL